MAGGATTTTLLLSFASYVLLTIAGFYWCILADPDESRLAELFQVTIPRKLWATLSNSVGGKRSRTFRAVEWLIDRFLLWMYCTVVFGSWSLVFFYVYPWIDLHNIRIHKYIGYVVFVCCVVSWRWAASTSPGLITRENLEQFRHCYPYDHLLFVPTMDTRLQIPRLPRSKFDRFKYKQHVPRYDHFCGWIHNTVGEQNYRFFLAFLLVHAAMCCYGTFVLAHLFHLEVQNKRLTEVVFFNRSTGEEYKATRWIIFQYLFHSHTPEASLLAIMAVMAVALTSFFAYHCYLICNGFTTNEAGKWSDMMRWYKQQLKLYNNKTALAAAQAAVQNHTHRRQDHKNKKEMEIQKETNSSNELSTDDENSYINNSKKESDSPAAVAAAMETEEDNDVDGDLEHPGPWPINIYNRGLVENWKEVLFPPSLRPENLQRLEAAHHRHTEKEQRIGTTKGTVSQEEDPHFQNRKVKAA